MNDAEEPFDPMGGVSTPPVVVRARDQVRPAVVSVVSLTLLTGCIFPLVLFALGRLLYPSQAAGSLVTRNGVVIGSRLIGQNFTRPEYFHPRPSIAGAGYDGTASGGTNLGPSHPNRRGYPLRQRARPAHQSCERRFADPTRGTRARPQRGYRSPPGDRPHHRSATGLHGQPSGVGTRSESRSGPNRPAHSSLTILCAGWNMSFFSPSFSAWPTQWAFISSGCSSGNPPSLIRHSARPNRCCIGGWVFTEARR